MSDEIEPSGSLAWKTNRNLFWVPSQGPRGAFRNRYLSIRLPGLCPRGGLIRASAHLDSCIAFSDK